MYNQIETEGRKERIQKEMERKAVEFSRTDSLLEAASLLFGVKVGSGHLQLFYNSLATPEASKVISKLSLIQHPVWNSVILFADR